MRPDRVRVCEILHVRLKTLTMSCDIAVMAARTNYMDVMLIETKGLQARAWLFILWF